MTGRGPCWRYDTAYSMIFHAGTNSTVTAKDATVTHMYADRSRSNHAIHSRQDHQHVAAEIRLIWNAYAIKRIERDVARQIAQRRVSFSRR